MSLSVSGLALSIAASDCAAIAARCSGVVSAPLTGPTPGATSEVSFLFFASSALFSKISPGIPTTLG